MVSSIPLCYLLQQIQRTKIETPRRSERATTLPNAWLLSIRHRRCRLQLFREIRAALTSYFSRAALTISTKLRGSRLAPPTSAPSMSGWLISSAAFSGFTLPPY
jgi:hypothetical protein